jgi:FixJ family two-component response regulator
MPSSTKPTVLIVGEMTPAKQWEGLLRQLEIEPRSVRFVTDSSVGSATEECVLLVLTSDRELDGLQACARWLALNDERPGLVIASSAETVRLLKRLAGNRLEVFEGTEPAHAVAERIRSAVAAHTERRRRRAVWSEIAKRFQLLTVKDRDVLELLLKGKSNKMIARDLGVTERAIEMRRAGLMKKLGTATHAELIRLVTQFEVFADFDLPLPVE